MDFGFDKYASKYSIISNPNENNVNILTANKKISNNYKTINFYSYNKTINKLDKKNKQ